MGRTTNYNHTLTFNYNVPLNKIPYMDWTSLVARYTTHFTWQAQPLFAINDPAFNVGNSIQNQHTIQLNPTLNLVGLYNKFPFLRKFQAGNVKGKTDDEESTSVGKVLLGLLTSVKSLSAAYTRTEGTFLPGYLPNSDYFGQDFSYGAPGIGFLLGSQADIRQKAVANGWITTDTLQNQLYLRNYTEDIHLKGSLELFRDFKIDLIAFKTQDHNYQSNFKYLPSSNSFQNLTPTITGDYIISYMSIGTAFAKVSWYWITCRRHLLSLKVTGRSFRRGSGRKIQTRPGQLEGTQTDMALTHKTLWFRLSWQPIQGKMPRR